MEIGRKHNEIRSLYKIPNFPQRHGNIPCGICANLCRLNEGEKGVCSVRIAKNKEVVHIYDDMAVVHWYKDPLPTNCVADWICPGRKETGYYNLAVFFGACSFNCLYCQNWHYRKLKSLKKVEELVHDVTDKVSCICFFGGDPAPQIEFACRASQIALKKREGKILRVCWETNGSISKGNLEKMAELSLKSGGCIKIDIKAWSEEVYFALTGTEARDRVFDNFAFLSKYIEARPDPPFLVASTLLVPGYVDEEEVEEIANFIASLNKNIPYALLAFYPCFYMTDLPTTSLSHAERCLKKAKQAGLSNVRIGNIHLLSAQDYKS